MRPVKPDIYIWTRHAQEKMRYYRLTEAKVKRIIRCPARLEEGVVEGAVACMQPTSALASAGKPAFGKKYSEIWAMYTLVRKQGNPKFEARNPKQIKIITAWRYPGRSPVNDPVPQEVLRGVKRLLYRGS